MQATVENVFTVKSIHSVNDTMNLIQKDIEEQNGIVFVRIDQKKAAEEAGIIGQLNDTELILFGNPKVGTQLMVANGSVSIELPLRASCWRQNETVYLSITNPLALEIQYNLSSKKQVLEKMAENVKQMMNKIESR
ncbi:unnamed protein product [Rotaria socialis]|uniref:DUF302 domain-containing protein n=1 Tax=Rotaria socialis TaxID=392032 RepID=A0A820JDM2_9BILA|nr:unnamed protein product [Rotaria socialis]CAF3233174.1 unnamed protein product [Rotaria socialis]CAF3333366.1 unnamed protein product [Rotaria socialis]CAF3623636.1 unnamed protein product [Rotaria socialis]CAF4323017.1 unnamed protein product [Rotaria socialis]